MKTLFIAITLLTLTISLCRAEDLMKFNLDDVSAVTPQIQTDLNEKVEGKGSVNQSLFEVSTICPVPSHKYSFHISIFPVTQNKEIWS
jgi:hypothetical protein